MRIIFFLIPCLLMLFSCIDKVVIPKEQDLISTFIKENAGDPDSYEPISFGKIDSVTNSWFEHPNYTQALDRFSKGEITQKEYNSIRDTIQSKTTESVMYYVIQHKYRIKNGFGGKILRSEFFKINNNMTKVIDVE